MNLHPFTTCPISASNRTRRGRPRLPEGQRKDVFSLRIAPNDFADFEGVAKLRHQPIRQWIIESLRKAAMEQANPFPAS